MLKKIFIIAATAALSIAGTLFVIGNDDSTSITIHGHMNEEAYEVQISNDQLDAFLSESGMFMCDNNMCHIEH